MDNKKIARFLTIFLRNLLNDLDDNKSLQKRSSTYLKDLTKSTLFLNINSYSYSDPNGMYLIAPTIPTNDKINVKSTVTNTFQSVSNGSLTYMQILQPNSKNNLANVQVWLSTEFYLDKESSYSSLDTLVVDNVQFKLSFDNIDGETVKYNLISYSAVTPLPTQPTTLTQGNTVADLINSLNNNGQILKMERYLNSQQKIPDATVKSIYKLIPDTSQPGVVTNGYVLGIDFLQYIDSSKKPQLQPHLGQYFLNFKEEIILLLIGNNSGITQVKKIPFSPDAVTKQQLNAEITYNKNNDIASIYQNAKEITYQPGNCFQINVSGGVEIGNTATSTYNFPGTNGGVESERSFFSGITVVAAAEAVNDAAATGDGKGFVALNQSLLIPGLTTSIEIDSLLGYIEGGWLEGSKGLSWNYFLISNDYSDTVVNDITISKTSTWMLYTWADPYTKMIKLSFEITRNTLTISSAEAGYVEENLTSSNQNIINGFGKTNSSFISAPLATSSSSRGYGIYNLQITLKSTVKVSGGEFWSAGQQYNVYGILDKTANLVSCSQSTGGNQYGNFLSSTPTQIKGIKIQDIKYIKPTSFNLISDFLNVSLSSNITQTYIAKQINTMGNYPGAFNFSFGNQINYSALKGNYPTIMELSDERTTTSSSWLCGVWNGGYTYVSKIVFSIDGDNNVYVNIDSNYKSKNTLAYYGVGDNNKINTFTNYTCLLNTYRQNFIEGSIENEKQPSITTIDWYKGGQNIFNLNLKYVPVETTKRNLKGLKRRDWLDSLWDDAKHDYTVVKTAVENEIIKPVENWWDKTPFYKKIMEGVFGLYKLAKAGPEGLEPALFADSINILGQDIGGPFGKDLETSSTVLGYIIMGMTGYGLIGDAAGGVVALDAASDSYFAFDIALSG